MSDVTLESIDAKLDKVLALAAAAGITAPEKAYERPEISVDQAVVDGKTVNADGSIWTKQNFGPDAGKPIQIYYGYISPMKRPDIWAFARKHLDPVTFERWENEWKANPYGVYKADIREQMANGSANFLLFDLAYGQPKLTFVQ